MWLNRGEIWKLKNIYIKVKLNGELILNVKEEFKWWIDVVGRRWGWRGVRVVN